MSNCCPGTYNLCIYQGGTVSLVFVWTAGLCCGSGTIGAGPVPVNLLGYSATMQIRQYRMTSAPLLYDASSNLVLGGAAGTITLKIPASTTEGFTWTNGVYDLILTDPFGVATPLLSGTATVNPGIST